MKQNHLIFFVFLPLLSLTRAWAYSPIAQEEFKAWSLHSLCDNTSIDELIEGDTTINGILYRKVYHNGEYMAAVRDISEEQKMVYYDTHLQQDIILYDFSITDVVIQSLSDTSQVLFRLINREQSEQGEILHIQVEVQNGAEEWTYTDKWIEGIGSIYGLIRQPWRTGSVERCSQYVLVCVSTIYEMIYRSEYADEYPCYDIICYDCFEPFPHILPSLCNRWNVLMDSRSELGSIGGEQWTNGYKLQGDTTINNVQYSCLLFADGHQNQQSESWEWIYHGAIRETANAEIYYIPSGSTLEYLLYAFNAQVGDRIENLYVLNDEYNAWAIVKEISEKEIILDLYEQLDESNNIFWHDYVWIKGVGAERSMFEPLPNGDIEGYVVNSLLCAYSGDLQLYTSESGEEYGCEYWSEPSALAPITYKKSSAAKIFRDGQLYIVSEGRIFNAQGVEVR